MSQELKRKAVELAVRFPGAGGDLYAMLMLLPAHRLAVRSAVRDHDHQRLPAELEAPLEHFDDHAVLVLVNLVTQRAARSRTALAVVRTDRPEERAGFQISKVPYRVATGFSLNFPLAADATP